MVKNMSSADRLIRFAAAVIIALLVVTGVLTGLWATILLVVAIILALTGLVGTCPIYLALGINNNRKKQVV
ncbi:MAG TPA: DUF2892 domain-containing protein [Ignavibacteriaceae bacterium]|nr:DUF2892 domain-containing protein [Ignavibacteriaceae bacterium]